MWASMPELTWNAVRAHCFALFGSNNSMEELVWRRHFAQYGGQGPGALQLGEGNQVCRAYLDSSLLLHKMFKPPVLDCLRGLTERAVRLLKLRENIGLKWLLSFKTHEPLHCGRC